MFRHLRWLSFLQPVKAPPTLALLRLAFLEEAAGWWRLRLRPLTDTNVTNTSRWPSGANQNKRDTETLHLLDADGKINNLHLQSGSVGRKERLRGRFMMGLLLA